jgi:hypothetical protein
MLLLINEYYYYEIINILILMSLKNIFMIFILPYF